MEKEKLMKFNFFLSVACFWHMACPLKKNFLSNSLFFLSKTKALRLHLQSVEFVYRRIVFERQEIKCDSHGLRGKKTPN